MIEKYLLVENKNYSLILSVENLNFDYYTDVEIELIKDKRKVLLLKDNILFLKNLVEEYEENDIFLDKRLDEKNLGLLLNEYYYNLYEEKSSDNIILDSNGIWIGERYCCFLTSSYATWIYKVSKSIIIKVTPVFSEFERDEYINFYSEFICAYKDVLRERISLQQLMSAKNIIFNLFRKCDYKLRS